MKSQSFGEALGFVVMLGFMCSVDTVRVGLKCALRDFIDLEYAFISIVNVFSGDCSEVVRAEL